jgi:hypothetical protein
MTSLPEFDAYDYATLGLLEITSGFLITMLGFMMSSIAFEIIGSTTSCVGLVHLFWGTTIKSRGDL